MNLVNLASSQEKEPLMPGWCNTRFHSDGKRRFGQLKKGFCLECQTRRKQSPEAKRIEKEIALWEGKKEEVDKKISALRYQLNILYEQETKSDAPLPKETKTAQKRKSKNFPIQYQ